MTTVRYQVYVYIFTINLTAVILPGVCKYICMADMTDILPGVYNICIFTVDMTAVILPGVCIYILTVDMTTVILPDIYIYLCDGYDYCYTT